MMALSLIPGLRRKLTGVSKLSPTGRLKSQAKKSSQVRDRGINRSPSGRPFYGVKHGGNRRI